MRPCSLPFSLSLRRTKAFEEKTGYRTAGDDGRTDGQAGSGAVGGQRRREVDRVRSVWKSEPEERKERAEDTEGRKEPFCAQKVIPQKNFEGQIPACEQRRPSGGESAGF